jgi:hypothetical protein
MRGERLSASARLAVVVDGHRQVILRAGGGGTESDVLNVNVTESFDGLSDSPQQGGNISLPAPAGLD